MNIYLQTLISTGIASALAGLFSYWFKTRLEKSIQHEYDAKLEGMKATLAQNHFRFSHVFERTANTIAELYKKIEAFRSNTVGYIMLHEALPEDERATLWKQLEEAKNDMHKYFLENKIFIPKKTADKILKYTQVLIRQKNSYAMMVKMERSNVSADDVESAYKQYSNAADESVALLDLLMADFQTLLGFPNEKQEKH